MIFAVEHNDTQQYRSGHNEHDWKSCVRQKRTESSNLSCCARKHHGKFERGESPEECALREAKEETGLTLTSYRYRGIVTFVSDRWEPEYMHLFTAGGFEGTLKDCDEGELAWIGKKDLLALPAWEGDKVFLRLLDEEVPFFSLKLR